MRDIRVGVEVQALIGAAGMGVVGGDLTHRHNRGWIWTVTRCEGTPAKSRHR